MVTKIHLINIVIATTLFVACDDSKKVVTYRLAKEPAQQVLAKEEVSHNSKKKINVEPHSSWKESKASGMRTASYLAYNNEGDEADISLIFLPGFSGSPLANVNRWREQIELGSIDEDSLANDYEYISTSLGQAKLIDYLSNKGTKYKEQQRLIAAILSVDGGTWFFKILGNDRIVKAEKSHFKDFVKSFS